MASNKGIVSILGSDCERTKSAVSLRRTLSADMSSKKWQSQLKKIASSGSITDSSSSSSSDDYESRGWNSIREENDKKQEENPGHFDIWSSILSQKAQEDTETLPPPYVHPLVKRTASSLSEKSLEICTESLGSETGSDGFSSVASETCETEEDPEEEQEHEQEEDWDVAKYNFASPSKKSSPKSFPSPLPSLVKRDGTSLHMKPCRGNGRLVLEAVSVPSQNNFQAQRQDGRLVLTFVNSHKAEKNDIRMFENSEGEKYETEAETEEVEDEKFVMEEAPKLSGGLINVHRLALMMNKPMVLSNRNPTWPGKFNEILQFEPRMIPMSSQAVSAAEAASTFNAYEYYWRTNPTATTAAVSLSPITKKSSSVCSKGKNNNSILSKNLQANEKQKMLVLIGNKGEDCLVPLSKGCKEPRRSLLFWEPYCIAIS